MSSKPLIMQACEVLGVPPDIKIADLRALVDLKLKILPEGSKEANLTRMAYDVLACDTPEARRYQYDQAAYQWAKAARMSEVGMPAPAPQPPVIEQRRSPVQTQTQAPPRIQPENTKAAGDKGGEQELHGLAKYERARANLRKLVEQDGKNAPAWAIALSR